MRICSRQESAKTQPECSIIEGVTYCKCYTDLCNRAERKDVTTTVLPDTTSTSTSQQGQESSTATPETTTTPIQGDVAPTTQEASQSSSFATLHPGILVAVGLLTLLVSHFWCFLLLKDIFTCLLSFKFTFFGLNDSDFVWIKYHLNGKKQKKTHDFTRSREAYSRQLDRAPWRENTVAQV